MSKEARTSLSKAATFQDQNAVHEIFSELRREDPIAWCPELDGGRGFWSVTKYDDIQFVSKNPKKFSSDRLHGGITFETAETRRIRKISRSKGVQDKFKDLNINVFKKVRFFSSRWKHLNHWNFRLGEVHHGCAFGERTEKPWYF